MFKGVVLDCFLIFSNFSDLERREIFTSALNNAKRLKIGNILDY